MSTIRRGGCDEIAAPRAVRDLVASLNFPSTESGLAHSPIGAYPLSFGVSLYKVT